MTGATTDRRGFALLAVLWLVAVLSLLVSVKLAPVLVSLDAMENRLHRTRGLWAARACVSLLQFRYVEDGDVPPLDSVALGPGLRCRAGAFNPDERIHPNRTDSLGLARALRDPVQVASLLDWIDGDAAPRPEGAERAWYADRMRRLPRDAALASPREIGLVRGFEAWDAELLDAVFTTTGDGSVSPNRAPVEVLRSVSVLPPGGAEEIVALRETRRAFRDAEEVALAIGMSPTIEEFRELSERLSFAEHRVTMRVRGEVDDGERTVASELLVSLSALSDRLAVLRMVVR